MTTPSKPASLIACHATAFFSLGQIQMAALLMPLWGLSLGASAGLIGLMIGLRSLLPTCFAIHAGSLMDMVGARAVLIWVAVMQLVVAVIFPFLTSIWLAIALQLIAGFAQSIAWVGAQAQIGQVARGDATAAGRFSFCANIGAFAAPLAVGIAWDTGGHWAGFSLMAAWALGLLVAALKAPVVIPRGQGLTSTRLLIPRTSDYVEALRLLAYPLVAVVVVATFVRIAVVGIQGSFYPVYLEGAGISATLIGILIGAGSLAAGAGSLSAGGVVRRFGEGRVLVAAVASTVVAIAITPLLPNYATLMMFAILMGAGIGLSLVGVMTVMSNAVGPEMQGRGVGLRSTTNNLSWMVVPVLMGAMVELVGLENAFYWAGIALAVLVLCMLYMLRRRPRKAVPDAAADRR